MARRLDAIAEAAHGLDVGAAKFSPQPRDEHLHGVRVAVGALRVDVLGQLRLRHHAAALVHQVRQHAKLVAGQLDGGAVHRHLRAARIEHQPAASQLRRHLPAARAGSTRAAAPAPPRSGTASRRSRPRRRRCPAPSRASCRAPSAPAPAPRSPRRASGAAPSGRRSAAARGRGPPRRTARSGRGNRRARRRPRSPRHSRRRPARLRQLLRDSSASSSTTSTRTNIL